MTSADLQASIDSLTTQVAQTVKDIADLKAKPALITQEQLDSNVQAVNDAVTALKNA